MRILILLLFPLLALAAAPKPIPFGDWIMLEVSGDRFVALTGNGPARLGIQFDTDKGCKPMLAVSAPELSPTTAQFDVGIGEESFKQSTSKPLSKALLAAMRKGKTAEIDLKQGKVSFSLGGSNAAMETAAARCAIGAIRFEVKRD